ncbi:MAG: GNAT family N-acetyltransferase [Lachnospiraceae bacterium]|nr:GNAT family N-acetyltransferase [Lachnospiraceae bacterium]
MIYKVIDSHRTMTKKTRKALEEFFQEVKGAPAEVARRQVDFCWDYERQYAVKWFEVLSWDGDKVVGYLRCMRDPETVKRWYVGDVHVRKAYWQQGIATQMYAEVFATLQDYDSAEKVVVSIDKDNVRSIGLHTKLGFRDTKEPCVFADFYAQENETCYEKLLFMVLDPPRDPEIGVKFILPVWTEWKKQCGTFVDEEEARSSLLTVLRQATEGAVRFETIWNGMNLCGFRMNDGTTKEYNKLKEG